MFIAPESPRRADVIALLEEHLADMVATSPAESVHAFDVDALDRPEVTFWTARGETGELLGTGALYKHGEHLGEIKSMRTAASARGQGVAAAILTAILEEARSRGIQTVSLETGTEDYFQPAHRLYERHGFAPTGPFADYTEDPNSRYYTLAL